MHPRTLKEIIAIGVQQCSRFYTGIQHDPTHGFARGGVNFGMVHADWRGTPGRGGSDVLFYLELFGLIEARVSGRKGFDLHSMHSNRFSGHDLRRPCDWIVEFIDGLGPVQLDGGGGGIDEIVKGGWVLEKTWGEVVLNGGDRCLA